MPSTHKAHRQLSVRRSVPREAMHGAHLWPQRTKAQRSSHANAENEEPWRRSRGGERRQHYECSRRCGHGCKSSCTMLDRAPIKGRVQRTSDWKEPRLLKRGARLQRRRTTTASIGRRRHASGAFDSEKPTILRTRRTARSGSRAAASEQERRKQGVCCRGSRTPATHAAYAESTEPFAATQTLQTLR